MAFDEKQALRFREPLSGLKKVTERRMFGGLCFMWNGNMLCGVNKDGGMARVGKENHAAALKLKGVMPMAFTGRPMGGMVDLSAAAIQDDRILSAVLELAKEFVGSLPEK